MVSTLSLSFGLFDVSAKPDSAPAAADKQTFVSLADLKAEDFPVPTQIATVEENQFLLDGNYALFPDTPQGHFWGWWSSSMSGADGSFTTNPTLTISFSENHSSLGLTLCFDTATGDYLSYIKVTWKDANNNTIIAREFRPDAAIYFANCKVEEFRQISIEAITTSKPYRYAKLEWIGYGIEMVLSGDDITAGTLLEELDPLSSEITVNTLDFSLHSNNAEFSLLNPQGAFSLLQQRQAIVATEHVNGSDIPLGTFYLDEWTSDKENNVKMTAIDWVGLLDKTTYRGGIYTNVTAASLIADIMADTAAPYELDSSLQGVTLSGYLPICTHREALQQVAVALCAVVDCSRADRVKIYPPPKRPSSMIRKSRKFGGTLKLEQQITGVDIISHKYVADTEVVELFNDTLEAGSYEITFDSPAHSLTITGGSISTSGANYANITVAAQGEVTINGKGYKDNTRIVKKRTVPLPAGTPQKVLTVDSATLVSANNATAVAAQVYDYYQNRYVNEVTILPDAERVGDMVIVESQRNEKLKGIVESMEYDLTGGWRAKAKIRGVRIETINGYYSGELKAGEEMGVL